MSASEAILRWSSTGGGWRSMVACMGFANLFRQADLFDATTPSKFTAFSTVSGSAWFSAQLFYSSQFYNSTVLSSPDGLYDAVVAWMDSYRDLSANVTEHKSCELLYESGANNNTKALCNIAIEYKASWADFVSDMLDNAAINAFEDADFINQIADAESRIPPLQQTDVLIESALGSTSRVPGTNTTVYFGPGGADGNELYTVTIPATYVVQTSDGSAGFWYGVSSTPKAYSAYDPTSSEFSFSDWEDYNLFPENGTATISNTFGANSVGNLQDPFGGGAAGIAGVAAASSALLGSYSGLLPSVFAQSMSLIAHQSIESLDVSRAEKLRRKKAFESVVSRMYEAKFFYNFAVCSQWPDPCGDSDGYFLDGIATDTTALSTTIGNYHTLPDADHDKPMKIILTNTNQEWDTINNRQQILMHFSTDFNQEVVPGSFLWLPYYNLQPIHSPQIFNEFMDGTMLDAALEPVAGSNMTTAILKGTTIDNPAFSVKSGQSVEILLINLNEEEIPTIIAGVELIEELTGPMADMTRDIATNEELLARIEAFVQEGPVGGDASSAGSICGHLNIVLYAVASVGTAFLFY